MTVDPDGFELQAAIAAAANSSGLPVLNAGRGQPNWLAAEPRDAAFLLGRFAVGEAVDASPHPEWGVTPSPEGIAARLEEFLRGDDSVGARFLSSAVDFSPSSTMGSNSDSIPTRGSTNSCGLYWETDTPRRTGCCSTSNGSLSATW